ncbi:MAG: hypothetical protein HUK28_03645 [Methanobrevibacter sp.]|nr:hypothetical protein [Methanobrevibacter sp.]
MNNNQLIVIVIAIIAAGCVIGGAVAYTFNKPIDQVNGTVNITTDNNTTNITANLTEEVQTSSNNQKNEKSDSDYDPNRDASHKYATADNPVTVQQSDGVYVYYGPGHYDYYAGDNHMSGGYYKEMNKR